METEIKKTNTQIKVDPKIYREFKSRAYLKEQELPEALEHAMNLYNEEAKRSQNE